MGTLDEIEEAVAVVKAAGAPLVLMKCTSAYPASPRSMNLRTIPDLAERFGVPVGLSDHTLGTAIPTAAVALGACMIEKHVTLSRDLPGPDSTFSLEPHEFKSMVESVRITEQALGRVSYELTESEQASTVFRRSLYAIQDIDAGQRFTPKNVQCLRPSHGLKPKYLDRTLGSTAAKRLRRGDSLEMSDLS
jgi:sialic acid synthase SpsE